MAEPATPFVGGWHLDAIAEYLEAVTRGEIRQLLINVPPRSTKSLQVAVFWPTWEWATHPETRWLFASYALGLAIRDSLKCRRLIESPWYQERWGSVYSLTGDQNVKSRYDNTRSGFRLSSSVDSGITGEGGDRLVVDDPHNVREAESEATRESTLEWWDQVMSTRLNDPKTGSRVIVMQRVHEADLAGHVLDKGGWEHLCLPMEYEPKRQCVVHRTIDGKTIEENPDPRTEEGELLCTERFGPQEIAAYKTDLGSRGYAGQMQQRPSPAEGGIIKTGWFIRAAASDEKPIAVYQFWDTAYTAKKESDRSVCGTIKEYKDRWRLDDLFYGKLEFPELKREAKRLYERDRPRAVIIETETSGTILLQEWRRESRLPILGYNPQRDGDKVARAYSVTPLMEAGKVEIPLDAPWLEMFLHECAVFPNGEHDDCVDVIVMALISLGVRRANRQPLQTMDFKVSV